MSSVLVSSRCSIRGRRFPVQPHLLITSQQQQQKQKQQEQVRQKHQVRVIVTRDLPEGQMRGVYAGEVHDVSAGYARNYLVPGKFAIYATPRNFNRCGLVDPIISAKEEEEEKKAAAVTMKQAADTDNKVDDEGNIDLHAADVLRRYLRNKSVRIVRNVDTNEPIMCHPGHVNAINLRDKLSKQLKIELDKNEAIHIRNEPVIGIEEKTEVELMVMLSEMDNANAILGTYDGVNTVVIEDEDVEEKRGQVVDLNAPAVEEQGFTEEMTTSITNVGYVINSTPLLVKSDCSAQVKQLGDYVAKITLKGGFVIPLKFSVLRR
jgi:ribosomal protein L9